MISGNGGIGSELVSRLSLDEGTKVFATFRTSHPLINNVEWIQFESENCEYYEKIIESIALVNNLTLVIDASGAFFASPLHKTTPEEIARVINTNLIAPLTLARACLKFLSSQGSLVLFSSIVTEDEIYGSSAYAASKMGLEKAITSLGDEFRRKGKSILGVRLGYMNYGMTFKIREELRDSIRSRLQNQEFAEIDGLLKLILESTQDSNFKNIGSILNYPK